MHTFEDVGRRERLDEASAREIMPVGKQKKKKRKRDAWESRLCEISWTRSRRVGLCSLPIYLHRATQLTAEVRPPSMPPYVLLQKLTRTLKDREAEKRKLWHNVTLTSGSVR